LLFEDNLKRILLQFTMTNIITYHNKSIVGMFVIYAQVISSLITSCR